MLCNYFNWSLYIYYSLYMMQSHMHVEIENELLVSFHLCFSFLFSSCLSVWLFLPFSPMTDLILQRSLFFPMFKYSSSPSMANNHNWSIASQSIVHAHLHSIQVWYIHTVRIIQVINLILWLVTNNIYHLMHQVLNYGHHFKIAFLC
jgi:hypothetical protein